jgi:hypothetical protein
MCSLLVPPEDLRVRRQADTHINLRIGWKQYSLSSYQDEFLARFQLTAILCGGSGQLLSRQDTRSRGKTGVWISAVAAANAEYGGACGYTLFGLLQTQLFDAQRLDRIDRRSSSRGDQAGQQG